MKHVKYSKHILVLLLLLFIETAAQAQTWAAPPASLYRDPNQDVYGSGIASMNQGCGWGSSSALAVDDYVQELNDEIKEMKRELSDMKKDQLEDRKNLKVMQIEIKMKLRRAFNSYQQSNTSYEDFQNNALKCKANFESECVKLESYDKCFPIIEKNIESPSGQAQCRLASQDGFMNKKFNYSQLCVSTGSKTNKTTDNVGIVVDGVKNPSALSDCQSAMNSFEKMKALEAKVAAAQAAYDAQKAKNREAERAIKKDISDYKKDLRELRKLEEDDEYASGAGVRGCPDGSCKAAAVAMMQRSSDINKLGWYAVGSTLLESGIRAAVDVTNGRRNAQLGYPTGPAPWVPSAMNATYGLFNAYNTTQAMQAQNQMGYGYPLAYGGVYGANQGGMGAGSIGCSPTLYGAQGYPNGPMQNNNGGGIYMPGYIPNYGYAGANGYPQGGMGGMPGMGGGMGGGFMGPGGTFAGGQIGGGFNPMGGMMPGMGGFGGPGMMGGGMGGMGGLPMFSQGGYPGYGSAGGGGINMYGGAGIPGLGGFGGSAGMGYNPYGMMGGGMGGMGGMPGMGSPYGMYGAMPGMGMGMGSMGGMNGMYGMPGMGGMGMGGMDYQMQMMNAQMQAMQDYNRRYMQATQTFTQAAQLQQQAYSILYGGGGGGMGMASPGMAGGSLPGYPTQYNYGGQSPGTSR